MANEQALAATRQDADAIDQAAEEAMATLLDVRGSMYAYVAPNQGTEFWGRRVGTLLDTLRQRLITLDAAVAGSGGSLADSLDSLDQLTAADRRARQYADRGELLLAGDVLFTEVRDLLNATTEQLATVRPALRSQAETRLAGIRREQAVLAAGTAGLWLIVALLLVPGSNKPSAKTKEPGEWRHELADTLKNTAPASDVPALDPKEPPAVEPLAPLVPAAQAGPDLKLVADICGDLSALTDVGALSGALTRAGGVLGAKSLIVWVVSSDGGTLSPLASHGIDPRIIERIGTIDRASANLTAEALRDNSAKVSAATATSGAALAVPMYGPGGPVGVLSAELQTTREADENCVSIAAILAAQLATLAAPMPVAAAAEPDAERRAESAAS